MRRTINSKLLELIETELVQTNQSNYYKSISINEYNLQTKLTLDLLVEKYGGFIYRYDNRVTLLINFSNLSPKNQTKVNRDLYNKVIELEHKVNNINQLLENFNEDKNKNYFSYMNYFKQLDHVQKDTVEMKKLISDVINKE